ncbi:MAG: DUF542 domain-containing protein [Ferruginibacter sp.]
METLDIIQKANYVDASHTVSEIVRSDYRSAPVFRKYNINYCCGGMISLRDTCVQLGIDQAALFEELQEATRNISVPASLQFDTWKTDFLIEYIINIHHAYLYKVIPELRADLLAFSENHKKQYPELTEVYLTFNTLSALLLTQLKNEESVLFPYIKQLDSAYTKSESYAQLFVRTLRKPLNRFHDEHKQIGELLIQLKTATKSYIFPDKACTNQQVVYQRLKEFHDDMVQHKHLEKNILFTRTGEMERQLLMTKNLL